MCDGILRTTLGWKLTTQSGKQRLRRGLIKPQYRIFYRELKNINDIINCCDVSTTGSTVTVISVNNQFQHEHSELASINALNIHPVGFWFFSTPSSVSICFHLLHTARLPPHLSPPPTPKNKHTNASHTQKRTGENRAPRKCNISVFNIEVYKIRAEMGSMAICLFIYFIRGGGGNLPISVCI